VVLNLAVEAPIKNAKEESLLYSDPTGYSAVMVTINSGITGLRSTPASIPIQGVSNGATLVTVIVELLVSFDKLLRQSRNTGDILLSSDLIEVRRFYSSPTLNSVYTFFIKSQLE
jgi:hypothetical protein